MRLTTLDWALKGGVLFLFFFSLTHIEADYNAESILCDDIEAICLKNKLQYDADNDTFCEGKERYLNPKICNCGHKCLGSIEKNESCETAVSFSFPTEVCGHTLECISEEVSQQNARCVYNTEKECINKSVEYDIAQVHGGVGPGQMKPNCNDDGTYAGRQCSPGSTCYCVDEDNNRLSGYEAPTSLWQNMTCECALYWHETEARGLDKGFRCLTDGNFDPMYCEGSVCYCYNPIEKVIDGTYPSSMMRDIPCYDPDIHNVNNTNPCTRDQQIWDAMEGNYTNMISEKRRPVCTRDGYYGPIQAIGPNVYCVDHYGEIIENFTMPLHMQEQMTCYCARRRHIMEHNNLGASKPKCCPDGSYYPYQTRGLLAYCVDENGNQIGQEEPITNIENLSCYDDKCISYDPLSFYE